MEVTTSLIPALWLVHIFFLSGIAMTKPMQNSSQDSADRQQARQLRITGSSGRHLEYHVPVLDNNTNFNTYKGRIDTLAIYCDTNMPCRLLERFFEPLGHFLISIYIYDCNFVNISRNALRGMHKLQTLWVNGRSNSVKDICGIKLLNVSNLIQQPRSELALHIPTTGICNYNNDRLVLPEGTFSQSENLIHLDLRNMRLNNTLWHALENLENLKDLCLTNNDITTIDINAIGKLKKLEDLYLDKNYIQIIPNGTFESLSLLSHLHLSRNRIRVIETGAFRGLTKLVILDLQTNLIRYIGLNTFQGLNKLYKLDLSENSISTFEMHTFKSLSKLDSLDLAQNSIKTIKMGTFEGLIKLCELDLSQNQIKTVPQESLSVLKSLSMLNMSYNYIETIPKLPVSLISLDLRNNQIVDYCNSSFEGLFNLTKVYFGYNGLVQLSEDTFRTNNKLHFLDLSANLFEQVPTLPPSLKTLDIRNNNIVDVHNDSFFGVSELSNVNLGSNGLVELPINTFWTNYNLHLLNLSFNQFTQLPKLPRSLSTLYLRNNNIDYLSSRSFPRLSHLSKLDLSENKIIECTLYSIPNKLWNLNLSSNDLSVMSFNLTPKLRYVDLRNNKLTSLAINGLKEYRLKRHASVEIYLTGNRDHLQCVCNLEVHNKDFPFRYDSRNDMQYYIRNLNSLNCSSENNFWTGRISEIRIETFICNTTCYNSCICYHWRYIENIYTVSCLNASLISVPANISVACTILELSGNKFLSLSPGNFDGLFQLKELYLSSSSISEIQERTFRELSSVMVLDLSHNNILYLNSGIFKGLNMLSSLNLSSNGIQFIAENTFTPLNELKYLDLSKNKLDKISICSLESIYKLVSLKLSNNLWPCECSFLVQLIPFITKSDILLEDRNDIVCFDANKIEIHIAKIYMPDFCPDQQPDSDTKIVIAITVSSAVGVIVITVIIVILWYKNRKFLKVCCFVNFGCKFGSVTNDEQNRLYDAFVSYSSKDDAFIIRELMPRLEEPRQGRLGYKLCVHFRDFPVGASIAESILDAVRNSRRVIMILSDNFLTSEWCHFEFQAAHLQLLQERKNTIIVVLLHDINSDMLDDHLSMFLNTRTYVKYGDTWFWNKIEYAMPKRKPATEGIANVDNIDDQENHLLE